MLWDLVAKNFRLTGKIIVMVTVFMIVIDYLELRFEDQIHRVLTGKPVNQCVMASILGAIPGCIDAFLVVSLYIHGVVGFGALVAVMLSTAGDEAFVMLAMAPEAAYKIFAILVPLGIVGGFLANMVAKRFKIKTGEYHKPMEEVDEYNFLKKHVYGHIFKEHVPRLFIWIFLTLIVIEVLIQRYDLASLIEGLPVYTMMVIAALVGVIPESGPHMVFLVLYSRGLIPFSVLLVSTLSQDGHGLLPLLSHSLKDTLYVQLFTTGFSLIVGLALILMGV